jgi:glycogen debranching enzyme
VPIMFDRSICRDLNETISREWLITNGLGGYAAGTVAGALTRMQHGLLVASSCEGTSPRLLLAKIDEEVLFDQRTYYLGTNEYRDGTLNPSGFVHLETFRLEEGFPIFTYRLGGIDGILLEKRIWMPQGLNTTYIQYRVLRPNAELGHVYRNPSRNGVDRAPQYSYTRYHEHPDAQQRIISLTLLPFAAYRPYNEPQYGNNGWQFQVQTHQAEPIPYEGVQQQQSHAGNAIAGCTIRAWDGAQPYHIFAVGHVDSETTFIPTGVWYWHFLRRHEQAAGLAATDDLYLPGVFRAKLWPGEDSSLTIIVTTEELSSQTFSTSKLNLSYKDAVEYQRGYVQPQRYFGEGGETAHTLPILPITLTSHSTEEDEEFLRLLLQAAGRFLAKRTIVRSDFAGSQSPFFNNTESVPLVIPGYFDVQDNTRDMLIAFPGLIVTTGRFSEARRILRSLARHFKHGLLPDRLPSPGMPLDEQDYGSVDTTLWYFYALDHYLRATRDYELLDDLYQRLVESIDWYIQGTYNGIRVDPRDGLLAAQQKGKALTWMNAIVKDVPVTPRYGKPVEVNALWYHALSLLGEWSQLLFQQGRMRHDTSSYKEQSLQVERSFNERFWYPAGSYLYDVIDGPDGDDQSLRPNQLLAISLRYPVLVEERRRGVLELVTRQLVTSFGLRSLASSEAGYRGQLLENLEDQQRTLHQGSAWPWLIGPFTDALLRMEASATSTEQYDNERVWRRGIQLLEPFRQELSRGVLGMFADAYEADSTEMAGHMAASALSIGEILRVYNLLAHLGVRYQHHALLV